MSTGEMLEWMPMNLKFALLREQSRRARILTIATSVGGVVALGLGLGHLANPFNPHRQAAPPVISAAPLSVATSNKPMPTDDPSWALLSLSQKQTLAPLKRAWPAMNDSDRQRWVGIASRFNSLAPEAQVRLRDRMVAWNQLTPTQRAHARLQYVQASRLSAKQKWDRWTAYQKLPAAARPQILASASVRVISPASVRVISPASVNVGTGATTVPMTSLFESSSATRADPAGVHDEAQTRVDAGHPLSEIAGGAFRPSPAETDFSSPPALPDPSSLGPVAR
ncbi:MAG: DUF3106 domain-containing protein [Rhizobacter sp.]|nr:DUF3106 domain-containing protein [Rhizobacter sp.]